MFPGANSHPTQTKSASVHGSIDGREIGRPSGLLQSGSSLIASHITPIAPDLEHDNSAAKFGGVNRIGENPKNDDSTITKVGDSPQKRHVSVNNQDHRLVSNQNNNENQPSQVVTFHPSQNHNQNTPSSIISLKPTAVSSHNSAFSFNINQNSNRPVQFINTNSNTEVNQNRQVSTISQNTSNNNHGFNNAGHRTNINRGILQSVSTDAGHQVNTGVLPVSNNNPIRQLSINKGVLQSSTNFANPQNSLRKGVFQASGNINQVEKQTQRVNVIQGGSIVQHHNDLHNNNNEKVTDNDRANLAQRLSSVLAFNKETNTQNKNNDIQNPVSNSKHKDNRSRQISSHSTKSVSQNSVSASSALSSGPCVAAFSVRKGLAATTDKTKPRRLTFQDVLTNTGGWSKSRNQFEVPCTGLYYFSFNAISTKDSDFTLGLMKDGRYQVTAYGGKDGYMWGGNSVLLFLTPGEKVYLELQEGELYEHPYEEAYTTFSGFLINSL
ncbi:C1q domain [Trinorchestia longiramus]|nr:C1q domain [Trinorchestia longiramus]